MISLALLVASSLVSVEGVGIRLQFNEKMHTRVETPLAEAQTLGPFTDSETLRTPRGELHDFALQSHTEEAATDPIGSGTRTILIGRAKDVEKRVEVTSYTNRPRWLFLRVRYRNLGAKPLAVQGYLNNHYQLSVVPGDAEPAFWSYQSASYEKRPDWVLPVKKGYRRANFLGMNDSDYGGGTPIMDVWRRDIGIGIGHIELVPKILSLPLSRHSDGEVEMGLNAERPATLNTGESFETVRSFVTVHHGDHFATLRAYSAVMQSQGIKIPESPSSAFEPIWCAWGYGREFTPTQVFETLPVAKHLGFHWATLDDGWQVAVGDWTPTPEKFPRGDADMKALVDRIHAAGLKAQLWWSPLAATPASRTAREHPNWLLKNQNGGLQKITWWNANYLCPSYDAVRLDAADFVRKALGKWGFDGLKIDGQHLNAAPACFNKAHAHHSPEDSFEGMPVFFENIWSTAQATKPGAVIEICPCGTGYSFFTLPYLNMTVAADPESSWQVRLKGKTLKALAGDKLAYFGDHVELSDGGTDFASTFGVGGVIGTNFAWPQASGKKDPKLLLTAEREVSWGKWTALYQNKRLTDGEYLGGLYDIGFDKPETHVIRKGDKYYYAFYAKHHAGFVELRGLDAKSYRVTDYVNAKELGRVQGSSARLDVSFDQSLLIEVTPE